MPWIRTNIDEHKNKCSDHASILRDNILLVYNLMCCLQVTIKKTIVAKYTETHTFFNLKKANDFTKIYYVLEKGIDE